MRQSIAETFWKWGDTACGLDLLAGDDGRHRARVTVGGKTELTSFYPTAGEALDAGWQLAWELCREEK